MLCKAFKGFVREERKVLLSQKKSRTNCSLEQFYIKTKLYGENRIKQAQKQRKNEKRFVF